MAAMAAAAAGFDQGKIAAIGQMVSEGITMNNAQF